MLCQDHLAHSAETVCLMQTQRYKQGHGPYKMQSYVSPHNNKNLENTLIELCLIAKFTGRPAQNNSAFGEKALSINLQHGKHVPQLVLGLLLDTTLADKWGSCKRYSSTYRTTSSDNRFQENCTKTGNDVHTPNISPTGRVPQYQCTK